MSSRRSRSSRYDASKSRERMREEAAEAARRDEFTGAGAMKAFRVDARYLSAALSPSCPAAVPDGAVPDVMSPRCRASAHTMSPQRAQCR